MVQGKCPVCGSVINTEDIVINDESLEDEFELSEENLEEKKLQECY